MKPNKRSSRLLALALSLVLSLSLSLPALAAGEDDIIYIHTAKDLCALSDSCAYDAWSRGKTVLLLSLIHICTIWSRAGCCTLSMRAPRSCPFNSFVNARRQIASSGIVRLLSLIHISSMRVRCPSGSTCSKTFLTLAHSAAASPASSAASIAAVSGRSVSATRSDR